MLEWSLIVLHSKLPELHRVLAALSAVGLIEELQS